MLDTPVHPGQTAGGTAVEMAQWLLPIADYAAGRDVTLVVENALLFRRAKDLWMLLEAIGHPAVGAAWDLESAARAGELPAVSVPTLNSRIQHVCVTWGQGEGAVEEFVRRLKGVGYGGYVTVGSGVGEEVLTEAAVKLKGWIRPPAGKAGRQA